MLTLIFIFSVLPNSGLCSGIAVIEAWGEGTSTGSKGCIDLGNATKVAHIGWPFHFKCDDIIAPAKRENMTIWTDHEYMPATVTLRNPDGSISWSVNDTSYNLRYYDKDLPYTVFEVQENMTAPFEMEYRIPEISYCSKIKLHLHPLKLVDNATCNYPDMASLSIPVFFGNTLSMFCQVTAGDNPEVYVDPAELKYEWWYNCSKTLPKNSDISTGNPLTKRDANFSDGGVYACAINYKGQRRLLARYSVCVRHGNAGSYSIKCDEKPEGKQEKDLNVTCIVDFGKGDSFDYLYQMAWLKKNARGKMEKICVAQPHQGIQNSTSGDTRIQCENLKVESRQKCFRYLPSPEEQRAKSRTFRLTMLIKNMQPSDAGNYIMNFTVAANDYQNKSLQISLDQDSVLISTASGVASVASILLVVVFLAVLCIWRQKDLLWFLKKYFGPYDKDNKKYVAYLAYHFSSHDMKEWSRNLTKKFVESLLEFLEEIHATAYDDHKDGDPSQQRIESVAKFQQQCHRIIIVLNEEYVTDHWNMHKAYFAVRNMIEGGAQVIFVVLPDVTKTFKDLPDEPRTALKHAMKMSTTIEWSGKSPLSGSFRRQLEYALPKLKTRLNVPPMRYRRLIDETVL